MVSNIPAPDTQDIDLVNVIVDERQGGRNRAFFNGIHDEWLERVQTYLDQGGKPPIVLEWPAANQHATKFQTLYKSAKDGSAQGVAIRRLRDHDFQYCPSCGEAGSPNTLDHYLPKEKISTFFSNIGEPHTDVQQVSEQEKRSRWKR